MAEKDGQDEAGKGATHPGVKTPRVSSRVPQTIEGSARDVTAPNPPPETQVASTDTTSFEAADAPLDHEAPHVPPPDGPVSDAPMPVEPAGIAADAGPVPPAKSADRAYADADKDRAGIDPAVIDSTHLPPRRQGMGLLLSGVLLVLIAAGVAVWASMGQGGDDALANLRRAIGFDSPPAVTATTNAAKPAAPAQNPAPTPLASTATTTAARPTVSSPAAPPPTSPPPVSVLTTPPTMMPASPVATPARPPTTPPPALAMTEARRPDPAPVTEARKPESPAASLSGLPVPATTAGDPRVADLDRRLSDLDTRVGNIATAPAKPAAETMSALAVQATRLGGINDMLAALDKRLAALEQQLAPPKSDARAPQAPDVRTRDIDSSAAKVVVAQGLLAAVQSGAPFAQPLAALRSLGVEDTSLARLSASAATGVQTLAALRETFAKAREKFRTPQKPASDAGVGDKMMARLASLVSIKPVAERAGPSPEAVASRVDGALGRGDLAAALAEVRTLPAADAALVKEWTDSAAKRADAEADARAQLAAAVAALAKPKS